MKIRVIDLIFSLKSSCMLKEEVIRNELSLSPSEFRCILSIIPGTDLQNNILCKKLGLSVSRGSRVIHKMIQNGYIRENKNSGDKRVMNVSITQKGIKTQNKIHKILEDCEHTILKRMSKTDITAFTNSLNKISDILLNN